MGFFATLDKRRAATVVVVLLIAFLSGHLMQTILAEDAPVARVKDAPDAAPVMRSLEEPRPLPTPPAATLVPILDRPVILRDRAEEPPRDQETQARNCDPRLFATPAPAAMVTVTVRATCDPNAHVLVRQGNLRAVQRTNADGRLNLRLPALDERVEIEVTIGDQVLSAEAHVPEAANFQHVALSWSGPQMLRLNAFEFGAPRNSVGHVWSGAPKSPVRASRGTGGFLTRLVTEQGPSLEIYSLPTGRSPLRGVVRLAVEAKVTAETCGRVAKARAYQPTAFRRLSETDVEVALPDCDRVGEVVVLQNLLRDVRLAGR